MVNFVVLLPVLYTNVILNFTLCAALRASWRDSSSQNCRVVNGIRCESTPVTKIGMQGRHRKRSWNGNVEKLGSEDTLQSLFGSQLSIDSRVAKAGFPRNRFSGKLSLPLCVLPWYGEGT